jgi:aminomethyltransferase
MKKTPFYEVGLESGAKMIELFGYQLPWEYSVGHQKEHLATRCAASLCDLDYMGSFLIEGPDALAFIQTIMTNDYSRKSVGSIQYTAMCDADGYMMDDGTVWRLGDHKYMFVSGSEDDFAWLEQNAALHDVSLKNITSEHTTLALQGPKSTQVLRKLTSYDLESIGYYRFVETQVAGVTCIVARMGYTGEFGYELHFHPQHGRQIWTDIMSAGAEVGIAPCGQAALESLRQEAGYLLVGNDHDKTTNPLEAGIGFTVKFGKDIFNGKQALTQIAQHGVRRHIVWLDLPSGWLAKAGDLIYIGEKKVGQVTSGSYSPTRKRGTAMGYVTPEHAIPGIMVTIESGGNIYDATLSVMPPYDPGNFRTRTPNAA